MQRYPRPAPAQGIRISLGVLLGLALTPLPGLAQPFPGARYMTGRFAFHVGPGGDESLYILDVDGDTLRSVPLDAHLARVGRGEAYALVARKLTGLQRSVQVDTNATTIGTFGIPPAHDVAMGRTSLVVKPRSDHALGTAFDLLFRGLNGDSLASYSLPGLRLLSLENLPYNTWATFSVTITGEGRASTFSALGDTLWSFEPPERHLPTIGVSPLHRRAVVGGLKDDLRTSRFSFLDSLGTVLAARDVPAFRIALFSPNAHQIALAGDGNLQLLDAQSDTAASRWTKRDNLSLPAGEAVTFSSDSARLHVVVHDRGFGGQPSRLWLRTFSNLSAPQPDLDSLQISLPADERIRIVALRELDDGRVRLVTKHGVLLMSP